MSLRSFSPYSHEAIIPREIFMQVQEELVRRRCVHTSKSGNRGKKSIVWRCVSRLENTGLFCDARTVLESTLEQVTVAAINDVLGGKGRFSRHPGEKHRLHDRR